MEEIKVKAELREKPGVKGTLSSIRAAKKIPAVIYGGKKEPVSIMITERDLATVLKSGANTVVSLDIAGNTDTAIIKEVQYHVVKDIPNHVDFQRISLKEKIHVVVPVKLTGESADVKIYGALINQAVRELNVHCIASKIPHEIEVDLTALTMTEAIYVKNLKLDKDIELMDDPEQVIVSLLMPREDEPAAAPAADAAAAQPESSSTKGKKEEPAADAAKK